VHVRIQAEAAVDPAVVSAGHLPSTYTLTTAFVDYNPPNLPAGFQPTVDLKPIMDELKALGALANPAYNINIVFTDLTGGPADATMINAGLTTLNITSDCKFAESEIPIEWREAVVADQQIPYEWLTETFFFADQPIPIEWLQIFFKKFDQMIPWEAQGISDTSYFLPVEWGGSPGAIAKIPFEWIDPLFSLFVEHEDDCNFWVAACEPAEWAAACWTADWVAEPLEVVEQSDASGLEWGAVPEEIGGTWVSELRKAAWETACNETLWTSDPPCTGWLAEACDTEWGTQTQPTGWNATAQGTRWTVLEPNVRGDR
jgi:hypothetical protein